MAFNVACFFVTLLPLQSANKGGERAGGESIREEGVQLQISKLETQASRRVKEILGEGKFLPTLNKFGMRRKMAERNRPGLVST